MHWAGALRPESRKDTQPPPPELRQRCLCWLGHRHPNGPWPCRTLRTSWIRAIACPWAGYISTLSLSFPICKVEILLFPICKVGCYKDLLVNTQKSFVEWRVCHQLQWPLAYSLWAFLSSQPLFRPSSLREFSPFPNQTYFSLTKSYPSYKPKFKFHFYGKTTHLMVDSFLPSLGTISVPGAIQGPESTAMNKRDKSPWPHESPFYCIFSYIKALPGVPVVSQR